MDLLCEGISLGLRIAQLPHEGHEIEQKREFGLHKTQQPFPRQKWRLGPPTSCLIVGLTHGSEMGVIKRGL